MRAQTLKSAQHLAGCYCSAECFGKPGLSVRVGQLARCTSASGAVEAEGVQVLVFFFCSRLE